MDTSFARRASTVMGIISLAGLLVSTLVGCYLYLVWSSTPSIDRVLVQPYENFMLYYDHYDWVAAPFLQAFRVASLFAVLLGVSRLLPRMAHSWKVWVPGIVFFFSIQVTVFNAVVNDMTADNWLFDVYLGMSWFEPWLVSTLGRIGPGLTSTGGEALAAFLFAAVALFAARSSQGPWKALVETCLFASGALFLFELGILEYKPEWWNYQVSQVQSGIGLQWFTNPMLYSLTAFSAPFLTAVRLAMWRLGSSERSASLLKERETT